MSRRSYYSSFGSAASNHKIWLQSKAIAKAKEAAELAKAKANQSPINKNAPAALTAETSN